MLLIPLIRSFCVSGHVYVCEWYRFSSVSTGGRRGRDRMVVGITTTCAISAYHH
jgi:hypothetical protein